MLVDGGSTHVLNALKCNSSRKFFTFGVRNYRTVWLTHVQTQRKKRKQKWKPNNWNVRQVQQINYKKKMQILRVVVKHTEMSLENKTSKYKAWRQHWKAGRSQWQKGAKSWNGRGTMNLKWNWQTYKTMTWAWIITE